ncbi:MAG: acyl-CoA reductase [bacterium]|nr:acyl-CoA reductase [bacterium]MDY2830959.1 acyl-CoA reductase [Alphaproteobacteria bacterium]
MNGVEYVIGTADIINRPMQVYDDISCAFIAELSAEILKSPLARTYPDLSALAFWGRKANLQKLKEAFGDTAGRLGRGLCFHIAPSNIPVNFAFTYLFGLLAGNANIVRLPSKTFPQIDALCALMKKVLTRYPEIEMRTAFVRYPRNNEITEAFCKIADARMIWGGDQTIENIKSLPASPRCVDIAFADRYSLAIIDGEAVLQADAEQMKRLAENFYNDTWLMDQNACSSPQIILWQNDSDEARKKFWDAAFAVAEAKYALQDAVSVDKYTLFCTEAVSNDNAENFARNGNLLYREEVKALTPDIINHRGKGGYFFEHSLKDVRELCAVITEKFQTITYFGIDATVLREELIAANIRGIDRIIPVGKAMDIDVIWDGHDLVRELSRIISLA